MEEGNTGNPQDSKPNIEKEIGNPTSLGGISLKNIFTVGGIIGLTIAGSFLIRAYLDYLRIQKLKEDLKKNKVSSEGIMYG